MHLTDVVTCAVVGVYVLLAIIFRPKPNLPLLAAPLILAIAGIAMAAGNRDLADQLAFSVFYLLVGAAALAIVERVTRDSSGE